MRILKDNISKILTAALIFSAGSASAKPSAEHDEMVRQSMSQAVGTAPIRVFRIEQSAQGEIRRAQAALQASGALPTAVDPSADPMEDRRGRHWRSAGWHLFVSNTANAASLTQSSGSYVCIPAARAKDDKEMKTRAMAFIKKELAPAVSVSTGEEIVFDGATHTIRRAASALQSLVSEEDCGVSVRFGRKVDGVYVVGPGSKIRVDFDPNGNATGFAYDWPRLVPTDIEQKPLSPASLRRRAKESVFDVDNPANEVHRMECGLFDPGHKRRSPGGLIQSGCAYFVKNTVPGANGGQAQSASIYVVPAAETPSKDNSWKELTKVCARGNTCSD
jgi:hypothetical protein